MHLKSFTLSVIAIPAILITLACGGKKASALIDRIETAELKLFVDADLPVSPNDRATLHAGFQALKSNNNHAEAVLTAVEAARVMVSTIQPMTDVRRYQTVEHDAEVVMVTLRHMTVGVNDPATRQALQGAQDHLDIAKANLAKAQGRVQPLADYVATLDQITTEAAKL